MNRPPAKRSPRSSVQSPRPFSLSLKSKIDPGCRLIIRELQNGLPKLFGSPICIRIKPDLKAHRGRLLSGAGQKGHPVHAASFIRQRQIVLETQLLQDPQKLKLILTHEVFHFIWVRLGNRQRAEFAALIAAELSANARGEMGESAGAWKHSDRKNYICESFCDTAAWLYSGVQHSPDFKLSERWKKKRQHWFACLKTPFRC